MHEKLKSVFEKIGIAISAAALFLLGLFFGERLRNNRDRIKSDTSRNGDIDANGERAERATAEIAGIVGDIDASSKRAEQSARTIAEIIRNVTERGAKRAETRPDI